MDVWGRKHRIPVREIKMTAPVTEIVKRMKSKGFLTIEGNRWVPQALPDLTPLSVKDLILRYRSILKGFLNYYSFVDNRAHLGKIFWILKESLKKTICYKKDIGSPQFYKQYGPHTTLEIIRSDGEIVTLDFRCPPLKRTPQRFLGA